MFFMEKKKLTMLVLGSMITAAHGEDFINAGKELNRFSSQYDFGTPVRQEQSVEESGEAMMPPTAAEENTTLPAMAEPKEAPRQELKKELNITCGAKCGIRFKKEDNRS